MQFNTQLTARPEDIDTSRSINNVGFTPDSRTIYFSKGGGLTTFLEIDSLGSGYTTSKQWKWTQLSASNDIQSALNRDGKVMALSNTYDIRLYDVASGRQIGLPMYGHTGTVSSLAFTPDRKLLVSGAGDGTLRLWDTTSGQSVGLPFQEDARWTSAIAISPDGHWLASVGSNNVIRVYDLSIQAWQKLACQVVRRNLYGPEWQQFLPDEPYRLTCPDLPADGQGIQQAVNLATARRKAGIEAEAKMIVFDTLQWVLATNNDNNNNELCWQGSLNGFAAEVLPACDEAVTVARPELEAANRDSRGLARALTGDFNGAVEDFKAFVEWSKQHGLYETVGVQREGWIELINQGQNPFTPEVLAGLAG
jgi:WD40 repeat protein